MGYSITFKISSPFQNLARGVKRKEMKTSVEINSIKGKLLNQLRQLEVESLRCNRLSLKTMAMYPEGYTFLNKKGQRCRILNVTGLQGTRLTVIYYKLRIYNYQTNLGFSIPWADILISENNLLNTQKAL